MDMVKARTLKAACRPPQKADCLARLWVVALVLWRLASPVQVRISLTTCAALTLIRSPRHSELAKARPEGPKDGHFPAPLLKAREHHGQHARKGHNHHKDRKHLQHCLSGSQPAQESGQR